MLTKKSSEPQSIALVLLCLMIAFLAACASAPTPTPTIPPGPTVAPMASTTQTLELVWNIHGDPNPLVVPIGIAVDSDGYVYVVDSGNERVQKFDRNGKFVTMWGFKGNGDGQFSFDGGGVIGIDTENNLYVGDNGNYRVQKFDRNGKFLTKWGSPGSGEGQFGFITSLKIDRQNHVYVLDTDYHHVEVFDGSGKFLNRWGKKGYVDGTFYYESSLAIDSHGQIWIAGATSFPPSPLQVFDSNGKWLKGYNPGLVGNSVTQFYEIIFDQQDNIYVSDQNNRRIVKFDSHGNWLGAWGGYGNQDGHFDKMEGIYVDKDGFIYVADRKNNNVQKFRQASPQR
ncbi:MAG: 6-bladed beta-propeller [Chloroflexi bacterium]|nr:6-bladed beta-propeller [Chloroflexota bacterium]